MCLTTYNAAGCKNIKRDSSNIELARLRKDGNKEKEDHFHRFVTFYLLLLEDTER